MRFVNRSHFESLINKYCEFFNVEPEKIKSKSRKSELNLIRYHIVKALKIKTTLSHENIGRLFADRYHSFVTTATQKHYDLCKTDETFKKSWEYFKDFINELDDNGHLGKVKDQKISIDFHNVLLSDCKKDMIAMFYNKLLYLKGKTINTTLIDNLIKDLKQ